jgi:hypothetical protein
VANLSGFSLSAGQFVELVFESPTRPVVVGTEPYASPFTAPSFTSEIAAGFPFTRSIVTGQTTIAGFGDANTDLIGGNTSNTTGAKVWYVLDGAAFGMTWSGPTLIVLTGTHQITFICAALPSLTFIASANFSSPDVGGLVVVGNALCAFSKYVGTNATMRLSTWDATSRTFVTSTNPPAASTSTSTSSNAVIANNIVFHLRRSGTSNASVFAATPIGSSTTTTLTNPVNGFDVSASLRMSTDGTYLYAMWEVATGTAVLVRRLASLSANPWELVSNVSGSSWALARVWVNDTAGRFWGMSGTRSVQRVNTDGLLSSWNNVLPATADGGPWAVNTILGSPTQDIALVAGWIDTVWVTGVSGTTNRHPAIWLTNPAGSVLQWVGDYVTGLAADRINNGVQGLNWLGDDGPTYVWTAGTAAGDRKMFSATLT